MSTAGKGTTGVIPTRSAQERDRACRALLEEAERLANAFHEGWLRNNEGFDRDRQRGEPPVPLKAFQYVARIARAGLENDTALAFLGPVRPAVVASLAALESFLWHDFLLEEYDVEPLRQRLRFFLGLLADATPSGEDAFPVETAGEIGPFELRSRLANAIEPELMEIFCDKIPVLREIRREAARSGPTRLLFQETGVQWAARLIHYLSPHTWGPFIIVDLEDRSYEATRRACELLDWLPSWSTVFIPKTPTVFTFARTLEYPPAPRLESQGRILVGTRRLGCKSPGELRLGDWPLFPGRVPSHPLTLAMIRWIDFLRGENRDSRTPLPSLRPAHLYWLEHHGREKLGFCRLALAESERLVERDERSIRRVPREMLEIVDDVRLSALDEDRARQLRAFALLLRAEGHAIGGGLDAALADLPEVEWLCNAAETGGSALWRLEIEVGFLETRGLIALRRQRATDAPPSEDAPRAAEKLRRILHQPQGSSPTRDLWLGRLCEVLMLESSSASRNDDFDASVAALREALGRLPETGHDELRFAATLRLGVSEFNRGNAEAAWACAEALPKLEVCLRTWYLEAQRRWLVGRLYHRALEEGEPQAGSEEASEEAMRKHLEKTAKLCELHGGRKGVDMALRELDVLARFYRERERADEYLEMLCRIGEYRNKRFYGSYYGPFCRYEVI